MKIHEFGTSGSRTVVMIHGECMPWQIMKRTIDVLYGRYYVFAVSLPGHDPASGEKFTSVNGIASRIGLTLIKYGVKKIDMLYGFSLGGTVALRMLADNAIPTERAVIDAGITPHDLPWPLSKLLPARDITAVKNGRQNRAALDRVFPPEQYPSSQTDLIYELIRNMTESDMQHIFDAADCCSMPAVFPDNGTVVEYWYGSDEEDARRRDIAYIGSRLPFAKLRRLDGMAHGQYLIGCPEMLASDLDRRMK